MRRAQCILTVLALLFSSSPSFASLCCDSSSCCSGKMCPIAKRGAPEKEQEESHCHGMPASPGSSSDCKMGARCNHTQHVVQPEIIYYGSPHWELKLGIPLGTTGLSPSLGVRAQVTWIFGKHGSD